MSVQLKSATGVQPDREQALDWLEQGHSVPVFRDVLADLETPVSAYLKLAGTGPSFLLESVESADRLGRYSFLGAAPYSVISMRDGVGRFVSDGNDGTWTYSDPLKVIEREIAGRNAVAIPQLPRFQGGAVGFLGYEIVRHFEELPPGGRDDLGLPDAMMMLVDTFVVFDHLRHSMKIVSQAVNTGNPVADFDRAAERIDELEEALSAPVETHGTPPT